MRVSCTVNGEFMELKIYIDRLKDGKLEKLSASVPTAFLDTHDAELSFQDTLTLSGEAYIANDHLILNKRVYSLHDLQSAR
jgi:predicted SprT family Zn-dependent metalloprotease